MEKNIELGQIVDNISNIGSISYIFAGTFIVLSIFSKRFGMSDPLIGILGTCTSLAASIWGGVSTTGSMFYWTPVIGFFSGTKPIAIRSLATKLVPDAERGRHGKIALIILFTPI